MIGYKNEKLKRIGVSKLRMMAGASKHCVVCDVLLREGDLPHLCIGHADWELLVVDTNDEVIRQSATERLHEKD